LNGCASIIFIFFEIYDYKKINMLASTSTSTSIQSRYSDNIGVVKMRDVSDVGEKILQCAKENKLLSGT
jgi:hypothetical protein